MKYRSSTEIIDTILRSLDTGATRTRIMYKAYLSYTQLKEYLALLESRQLVKYDEASQTYTITEKGLRFISAYDEIRELVSGGDLETFRNENQRSGMNSMRGETQEAGGATREKVSSAMPKQSGRRSSASQIV
jgi:predicted transcriptional regulator